MNINRSLIEELKKTESILFIVGILSVFIPGLLILFYFDTKLFFSVDLTRLFVLALMGTGAFYVPLFIIFYRLRKYFKLPGLTSQDIYTSLKLRALVCLVNNLLLTVVSIGLLFLFDSRYVKGFIFLYVCGATALVIEEVAMSTETKKRKQVTMGIIGISVILLGLKVFMWS